MKISHQIAGFCIILLFGACGQSKEKLEALENQKNLIELPDSINIHRDSLLQLHLSTRLNFKVKNTISAADKIENLCLYNGGYIAKSNVNYNVISSHKTQISVDSVEIQEFGYHRSTISLNLPVKNLPQFLDSVAPLVTNLIAREFGAENLFGELQYGKTMQGGLEKELLHFHENATTKSTEKNGSEQQTPNRLQYLQTSANLAKQKAEINELVKYASLNLTFEDTPKTTVDYELIATRHDEYQSDYGSRLRIAANSGLKALEYVSLFLATIWPLILVVLVLYVIRKKQVTQQ